MNIGKLWDIKSTHRNPLHSYLVKAVVFPVVMHGHESWTVKKAERQIMDAFELWYWRRLLRVPWTARRSNQSNLKEISPGCSLEGLMWSWNSNTLATWCEKLTHLKRPWCWERLRAGGEKDGRGWDGWMASLNDEHEFGWIPGVGDRQGDLECCSSWDHKEPDSTEQLNWCIYHQNNFEDQRTQAFPHVLPTWLPSPSLMPVAFSCTWIHQQRTGFFWARE